MFGMTISEVVHDSAKGSYRIGMMSDEEMRWYDRSCLSKFKSLPAREIRRARTGNKMSLDLFADYLQVSKCTLRKWEQGKPKGAALCLLHLAIDKKSLPHVACRKRHSHEATCLPPVRKLTASQIRDIRTRNEADAYIFSVCLNVNVTTVRRWEQGKAKPNGPALRLLNLVADKGLDFLVAHKGPVAPPLNVQKARAGSDKKARKTRPNQGRSHRDMKAVA